MSDYKFSGHDTFFCKQQWLLKGVELFDKGGVEGFTSLDKAIPKLGVGKNMVLSINYWLKSFGLLEGEKISTIAKPVAVVTFAVGSDESVPLPNITASFPFQ